MPLTETQRNRIVVSNLGLVTLIAQKVFPNLPLDDKVQEGTIGLMRAAERFDETRGVRFSTYASWWVRQAIEQMSRRYHQGPTLPSHADLDLKRLQQVYHRLWATLRRTPTLEELALRAGLSLKRAALLCPLVCKPAGLEAVRPDYVEQARTPWEGNAESLESVINQWELQIVTRWLFRPLTRRERYVVTRRVGIKGDPTNLSRIAEECHFSRERARQLWNSALNKMRRIAEGRGWEVLL